MKNFSFINPFLRLWMGIYVLLIAFPFPLNNIPLIYILTDYLYGKPKEFLVLFFGRKILGWEELTKVSMTGSGDTLFDFAFLILVILGSITLAGVIFLARYRKSDFGNFYRWTLLYARYYVGLYLISYGTIKFMNGQFPGPDIGNMEVEYGEMSPMGLAWRFFGYSNVYKAFMGIAELSAGLLIILPRTKVFGALLSIGVCLNIVLANFSFDIPVKIFSSQLLFFSILISLPYAKSLFELFFLQKTVRIEKEKPFFQGKRSRIAWLVVNIFFVGLLGFGQLANHLIRQLTYTPRHNWVGLYSDFPSENRVPFERLLIDEQSVRWGNESKITHFFIIQKVDEDGTIVFGKNYTDTLPNRLKIRETPDAEVSLTLIRADQTTETTAKRKKKEDYPLIQRGFNLIQEYPFNR